MSKVRSCCVCGKQYEYCPTCNHDPSWKMLYDTETCKEIMNIISGYNMNIISKDAAKSKIDDLHVNSFSDFKKEIASVLQDICAISNSRPKRKRKKKA